MERRSKLVVLFLVLGCILVYFVHSKIRILSSHFSSTATFHRPAAVPSGEQETTSNVPVPLEVPLDIHTSEELLQELVVVSGISANHYEESLDMIGSVHHFLPNTTLVINDLGLREDQVIELQGMRNVEVRKHDYGAYPDFRHKGYIGLGCYAWKPQVMYELSQGHMVVIWLDASLRLVKPLTYDGCIESVNKYSFVAPSTHAHKFRAVQFIRDITLEYFNYTRAQLKNVIGFQSGFVIFKMDKVGRSLMNEWFSCSLNHECICGGDIEPSKGRDHCNFKLGKNHSLYIGCHRYDQSTLTLICAKQFGIEHADEVKRPNCRKVYKIARHPTNSWRKYIRFKHQ